MRVSDAGVFTQPGPGAEMDVPTEPRVVGGFIHPDSTHPEEA